MKNVEIVLDELYSGDTVCRSYDETKGIFAHVQADGNRIIRFEFSSDHGWTKEKALKFIKNRDLNEIYWRKLNDGTIVMNRVQVWCGDTSIFLSKDSSEDVLVLAKELLGEKKLTSLLEIEQKHGSTRPFIVKTIAMNFNGKDEVEGNELRFYRKKTIAMIERFSNLPIHLGHVGFFEDYKERVGYTIAAKVEDGNPITYSYIFPYGNGAEFRDNLLISNALGLLGTHKVSMKGDPTEFEIVSDKDDKDYGKIRARIYEWTPESQDFVFSEAIGGSRAIAIANSTETVDDDESNSQGGSGLKTITEILAALKEHDSIALSDLLTIPAIKAAIESYVQIRLSEHEQGLPKNKDFMVKAIKSCDEEVFAGNERVVKIVNSLVDGRMRNIDASVEKISTLARSAGINLSQEQAVLIKNNLTGNEDDTKLLDLIRNASKFTKGLGGGLGGMFEKLDISNSSVGKVKLDGLGASATEIDLDKLQGEISVGEEL
jgi:hypothetical protein